MKIKTYYPKKYYKTGMQIPKFLLALGKFKTWFKVFVYCRGKIEMQYFGIKLLLISFFRRMPRLVVIINLEIEPLS